MGRPPFILDLSSPTTETMKIARDELRETPENVARGLKELQELLENDKTIKYDTDEEFLMCFLRPCKFYARSAYELVSNPREITKCAVQKIIYKSTLTENFIY